MTPSNYFARKGKPMHFELLLNFKKTRSKISEWVSRQFLAIRGNCLTGRIGIGRAYPRWQRRTILRGKRDRCTLSCCWTWKRKKSETSIGLTGKQSGIVPGCWLNGRDRWCVCGIPVRWFINNWKSSLSVHNTHWKFDWLVNTVVIVLNQDDKDELLCSEVETDVLGTIVVLKWEKRNYHPLKKSDC
jgi:hypothetical protein